MAKLEIPASRLRLEKLALDLHNEVQRLRAQIERDDKQLYQLRLRLRRQGSLKSTEARAIAFEVADRVATWPRSMKALDAQVDRYLERVARLGVGSKWDLLKAVRAGTRGQRPDRDTIAKRVLAVLMGEPLDSKRRGVRGKVKRFLDEADD